jgi:hypothetical protein
VAYGNRPTVIIFDRMSMNSSVFHDLADQAIISDRANLIFVTESDMKPTILGGVKATFTDVIIDSKGIIRYRTLDPNYMHNADEIEITLKDVK